MSKNSIERAMDDWHRSFSGPPTDSERDFYKEVGDDFDRTNAVIESERRAEQLEESRKRIEAELKELHKHDEFIEYIDLSGETTGNWDLLDYAKMLWDGSPTRRRKFKKRNPDYIGPK